MREASVIHCYSFLYLFAGIKEKKMGEVLKNSEKVTELPLTCSEEHVVQ